MFARTTDGGRLDRTRPVPPLKPIDVKSFHVISLILHSPVLYGRCVYDRPAPHRCRPVRTRSMCPLKHLGADATARRRVRRSRCRYCAPVA
ncbi:hypothetical protein EVAR_59048_1 [Eumeta japonica]|uniref:Uncharacterized protein n=1 Tax=Eumeta variegata TaxID=151549 RepID=A0A4C1YES5_EUMVA|nr:hypothetical protein EVAR_59048_1 [Eumeta japonica]